MITVAVAYVACCRQKLNSTGITKSADTLSLRRTSCRTRSSRRSSYIFGQEPEAEGQRDGVNRCHVQHGWLLNVLHVWLRTGSAREWAIVGKMSLVNLALGDGATGSSYLTERAALRLLEKHGRWAHGWQCLRHANSHRRRLACGNANCLAEDCHVADKVLFRSGSFALPKLGLTLSQ